MNLLLSTLLASAMMNPAATAATPAATPQTPAATATTTTTKPQTKPTIKSAEVHPVEAKLVERVNQERVRRGLRPLKLDMRLMWSARRHNSWMARNGFFQHGNAPVAENIALGQANTASAMNSWMNSSGHRANILNAGYTKIGVSAYRSRSGQIYWTQQFQR